MHHHTPLILAAVFAVTFLVTVCVRRVRTYRRTHPRCPECHARLKYVGSGWQCPRCWHSYERARAAGRSRGTPGTYNFGR